MPKQNDSLVERVDKLFSSLAATAANLNNTSKELSEVIANIEGALQRLNLGVTAWTVMTQGGSALTSSGSQFESEELGYGRTGRKSWGLMLKKGGMDLQSPVSEEYDEWPFNDAPRELRIRAVQHIPDLLEALERASREMAEKLSVSIAGTAAVAQALALAANQQQQRSIKGKPGRRS